MGRPTFVFHSVRPSFDFQSELLHRRYPLPKETREWGMEGRRPCSWHTCWGSTKPQNWNCDVSFYC